MSAYVSFEISIPAKNEELVNAMKRLGYHSAWTDSGKLYRLPNNCVWKPNITPKAGLEDLKECARLLDINIITGIVTTTAEWEGIITSDSGV